MPAKSLANNLTANSPQFHTVNLLISICKHQMLICGKDYNNREKDNTVSIAMIAGNTQMDSQQFDK